MRTIRVFIIDDHLILRRGLTVIINQEKGMQVCGEAEDGPSAIQAIEILDPDIVLLDISQRGIDGIDLINRLLKRWPDLPILVLSRHPEMIYAERAIHAGARGYVMQQQSGELLMDAIRRVLDGEIYVSEDIAESILRRRFESGSYGQADQLRILSNRELEVFRLIGQGYQPRQIAEQLNLSVKTVETYRTHIRQKLSLGNATDLIQFAIQWVQR